MDSNARSRSARYVLISILALVAMLVGFTGDKYLPITVEQDPASTPPPTPEPTASASPAQATEDPLASDPAPPLLDAGDLRTVGGVIGDQRRPAKADQALVGRERYRHGRRGFVSWAAAQLPAEPDTIQRQSEQTTVKQLRASRDPAGNKAADWLNQHGCQNVWSSFTAEQVALRSTTDDEAKDAEIKTVLKLASDVASAAQDRAGSPAASQPKPCSGATKPARSDCSCRTRRPRPP